jgi:hypothetical protein
VDETQLIEEGNDAEELLQAPAFNRTVNTLADHSIQTFLNSEPDDSEARDQAHRHYRAVVDIVSTLKSSVSVRNEIRAKNETKIEV